MQNKFDQKLFVRDIFCRLSSIHITEPYITSSHLVYSNIQPWTISAKRRRRSEKKKKLPKVCRYHFRPQKRRPLRKSNRKLLYVSFSNWCRSILSLHLVVCSLQNSALAQAPPPLPVCRIPRCHLYNRQNTPGSCFAVLTPGFWLQRRSHSSQPQPQTLLRTFTSQPNGKIISIKHIEHIFLSNYLRCKSNLRKIPFRFLG